LSSQRVLLTLQTSIDWSGADAGRAANYGSSGVSVSSSWHCFVVYRTGDVLDWL